MSSFKKKKHTGLRSVAHHAVAVLKTQRSHWKQLGKYPLVDIIQVLSILSSSKYLICVSERKEKWRVMTFWVNYPIVRHILHHVPFLGT